MQTRKYSVGAMRQIIQESANEFKPVMGSNVEKDNKKINDKAYQDSRARTAKYDGGAKNEKKNILYPQSDNKGMQDLEYTNMSKEFSDKVKSQIKGYTSADNEKKHKNEPLGNAEINDIKGMEDRAKAFKLGKDIASEIGLTSRELDKKDIEELTKTIYNESKKVSRLNFKNTVFISENHMMSKIPDDYKTEGKKFIMKDKENKEYIVEWHTEKSPVVINRTKVINEHNRIQELFHYKSGESKTTAQSRLNEDVQVNEMLNRVKQLMK